MSMSMYFTAERKTPLTDAERAEVDRLVARYPWERCVEPRLPMSAEDLAVLRSLEEAEPEVLRGMGDDEDDLGEPFEFYPPGPADPDDPDIILDGSLRPPVGLRHFFYAITYWCQLLAEVRAAVPGAHWVVSLDDSEIPWDETKQRYYLDSEPHATDPQIPVIQPREMNRPGSPGGC